MKPLNDFEQQLLDLVEDKFHDSIKPTLINIARNYAVAAVLDSKIQDDLFEQLDV